MAASLSESDLTFGVIDRLQQAARTYLEAAASADGRQLTADLLVAERQAKRQRSAFPLEPLCGTWRLCFTAPKKARYRSGAPTGKGFYVPRLAVATLSMSSDQATSALTIQNQLQVGPLKLRFSGPARIEPGRNLLAFDFTHLQLQVFGLTLGPVPVRGGQRKLAEFPQTPIGKLPFFALFAVTPEIMAARGRGGGLALWGKVAEPGQKPG